MAEATLIAPLVKVTATVLECIYDYKYFDDSVETFVEQVEQLCDSLKSLQQRVEERHSKIRHHSHVDDPVELQLSRLLKNVEATHKKTRKFFREHRIEKPSSGQPSNQNIFRTGLNIFKQDAMRRRLGELQTHYHFHAMQTTLVSQAFYSQTVREFGSAVEPTSQHYRSQQRLQDPVLLIKPRSATSAATSIYENWAAEPKVGRNARSEARFRPPVISEDQLRAQVQDDYTESQYWLFSKFGRELESCPNGIHGFDLADLLNKIVFWISLCSTIWPDEPIAYGVSYVQLMKAAWLLSETMKAVPSHRTASPLNESYLIQIQNKIITMHPEREPPDIWTLDRVPKDNLKLGLAEQVEPEQITTSFEPYSHNPIDFVAFDRPIQHRPYNDYQHVLRVLRQRNNASDDTVKIIERTAWIQRNGVPLEANNVENEYRRGKAIFTPAFYSASFAQNLNSGENSDDYVHIRRQGNDVCEVAMRSFLFWRQGDMEDFQHAITGYRIHQTINADSSLLRTRKVLGMKGDTEMRNVYTQIWSPEPLQEQVQSPSSHLHPSHAAHRNRSPIPGLSPPGSPTPGMAAELPGAIDASLFGTSTASLFENNTSTSKTTQVSVTVHHLIEPECPKLLVYGTYGVSGKQLLILPMDDRTVVDKRCCGERGKSYQHETSCCADVWLSWASGAGKTDAVVYTAEANDVNISNGKQNREAARVSLPIDVHRWLSTGKQIKFDRILIRFRGKPDKINFLDRFERCTVLYLKRLEVFEEEKRQRRLVPGVR